MQSYLEFEKSFGDPSRVQILYERAIIDFPVSSDLWLDYTRYLEKTNVVKVVYSKATRNYSWVGELWVRYLLCLKRGHVSEKEISTFFEKSLQIKVMEIILDLDPAPNLVSVQFCLWFYFHVLLYYVTYYASFIVML